MPVASFTLSTLPFCSAISLCAGAAETPRSFRASRCWGNAFSNAFGQQGQVAYSRQRGWHSLLLRGPLSG